MESHIIVGEAVLLRLGPEEHVALSRALFCFTMMLSADELRDVSGMPAALVYEFVHDVYAGEAQARAEGVDWIPGSEFDLVDGAGIVRSFPVSFDADGSVWRLTTEEFELVRSCTNETARRVS